MREYKFRVWDKDNKEMLYQGSNTTYNNSVMDCRIVLDELGFDVLVRLYGKDEYEYRNNCELMQYAGLYDKNGKEIYEGDITKDPDGNVFEVVWNKGAASFELQNKISHFLFVQRYIDMFEVIGNIHDNPDLLQK
jgi:hypothetical protein